MLDLSTKGCSLVKFYVSKIAKLSCMQERWRREHYARKTKNEKTLCNFHNVNQNFEVPKPLMLHLTLILFP